MQGVDTDSLNIDQVLLYFRLKAAQITPVSASSLRTYYVKLKTWQRAENAGFEMDKEAEEKVKRTLQEIHAQQESHKLGEERR